MPIILIFVVFYFLLIRPQQKKMREHRESLAAIRRGDKIITGGGIKAKVIKVAEDDELTVEIADDIRIVIMKSTVTAVISKSEPAPQKGATAARGEGDGESKGAMGKIFSKK